MKKHALKINRELSKAIGISPGSNCCLIAEQMGSFMECSFLFHERPSNIWAGEFVAKTSTSFFRKMSILNSNLSYGHGEYHEFDLRSIGLQRPLLDIGGSYGWTTMFYHEEAWVLRVFDGDFEYRRRVAARIKEALRKIVLTIGLDKGSGISSAKWLEANGFPYPKPYF